VKYLIDANVWLAAAIGGAGASEAEDLVTHASPSTLATSDFILHGMGILLTSVKKPDVFRQFLDDLARRKVWTLHLAPSELRTVLARMDATGLDFDDAFQYLIAEKHNLTIVSFDTDFDRTPRGRKTPAQVLREIGKSS
jgi:predicted nucleic acid-binding protein